MSFGAAPWGDLAHASRAVRVGDTVHVSGTVAQGETVGEQVKGCFAIIGDAIKEAGGRGLEDVGDLEELAGAHREVFQAAGVRPANTTFGGTLVRDWIKVEIEATAVV